MTAEATNTAHAEFSALAELHEDCGIRRLTLTTDYASITLAAKTVWIAFLEVADAGATVYAGLAADTTGPVVPSSGAAEVAGFAFRGDMFDRIRVKDTTKVKLNAKLSANSGTLVLVRIR